MTGNRVKLSALAATAKRCSGKLVNVNAGFLFIAAAAIALAGCSGDSLSDTESERRLPEGSLAVESNFGNEQTFNRLDSSLQAADGITVVARVDHSANAQTAELSLPPTKVLLFGNPQLGTPLMQSEQSVGIDLPQKFSVITDAGTTKVLWNNANYLRNRHGLTGVDDQLNTINNALQMFAKNAADNEAVDSLSPQVELAEGLVYVTSDNTFATTESRLRAAINGNENLTLVLELDHQENASMAGMSLRPTTVFVFGNPAAGTPLMQARQTASIDLPQKMLVFEDESGVVHIVYNRPDFIAERHGIRGQQERLDMIGGLLASLASTAAGTSEADDKSAIRASF